MENNQLFAGLPFLAVITNFSAEGDFEKFYMVLKSKKEDAENSRKKPIGQPARNSVWNGPATAQWEKA